MGELDKDEWENNGQTVCLIFALSCVVPFIRKRGKMRKKKRVKRERGGGRGRKRERE
jgi:hypothetical protein